MPSFLSQYGSKKSLKKKINTAPTKAEIEAARERGIDLGNKWNAYSREVRVHIYVKNMDEMIRFYNKILEFPVVRYWRYSDGDGTQIDLGGNLIELFSKGSRNYSHKNYHNNVSLSVKVRDVKKLYEKLSRKNIQLGELIENPWGDASFHVIDPEGNRLAFFSPTISKEKYYKVKKS
tara:strand:- start:1095 stop:1625 length:531 start_codon:yes stop_codon:yes gene_type:complete